MIVTMETTLVTKATLKLESPPRLELFFQKRYNVLGIGTITEVWGKVL